MRAIEYTGSLSTISLSLPSGGLLKMEQHESLLRHRAPRHGETLRVGWDADDGFRSRTLRSGHDRGRSGFGRGTGQTRGGPGCRTTFGTGRASSGIWARTSSTAECCAPVCKPRGTRRRRAGRADGDRRARQAIAQEDPTIDPNAPEWEPAEPRSPRKYRWEPLAEDQSASPTGLQVRTIGLGVSVQDRFNEFERRTGHSTSGKVTTLTAMITEWLAGGAQNYDTNETNANRNAALWDTGLLQPIPEQVIPWQYARDTYTSKEALGYDPVSGYPLTEVWVDPDNQTEFKLVPQFYNCDSIGYRYDLTGEDIITSWGAARREVRGQGRHPQRQPADPGLGRGLPEGVRPDRDRPHRQHDP